MEKRTMWIIAAVVVTLIVAIVLFRFVQNRSSDVLLCSEHPELPSCHGGRIGI